jgi:lysophospholipase L1-like esterase
VAVPRTDAKSLEAHAALLERAKKGPIEIYFEGDSITRRWAATDYPEQLENWNRNFSGRSAADFGWGGDRTQNILWRLNNGELDGVNPKIVVLLAGTNNLPDHSSPDEITRGIQAIVAAIRTKAPDATVILTGIFPRNDRMEYMPIIGQINADLAKMADGKQVRYLSINDKLADTNGKLFDGMMNPDNLHPTLKTYEIWASALKLIIQQLVGPAR